MIEAPGGFMNLRSHPIDKPAATYLLASLVAASLLSTAFAADIFSSTTADPGRNKIHRLGSSTTPLITGELEAESGNDIDRFSGKSTTLSGNSDLDPVT